MKDGLSTLLYGTDKYCMRYCSNDNSDMTNNIRRSLVLANQTLFFSMLDDAATCTNGVDDLPTLLADVPEVRMYIKFILVDLQTILKSCKYDDCFFT